MEEKVSSERLHLNEDNSGARLRLKMFVRLQGKAWKKNTEEGEQMDKGSWGRINNHFKETRGTS